MQYRSTKSIDTFKHKDYRRPSRLKRFLIQRLRTNPRNRSYVTWAFTLQMTRKVKFTGWFCFFFFFFGCFFSLSLSALTFLRREKKGGGGGRGVVVEGKEKKSCRWFLVWKYARIRKEKKKKKWILLFLPTILCSTTTDLSTRRTQYWLHTHVNIKAFI